MEGWFIQVNNSREKKLDLIGKNFGFLSMFLFFLFFPFSGVDGLFNRLDAVVFYASDS